MCCRRIEACLTGRVASRTDQPSASGFGLACSAVVRFANIVGMADRACAGSRGNRIMSVPEDYGRVLNIEASLTHLQERSERRAWYVAYSAAGVAMLSVIALA